MCIVTVRALLLAALVVVCAQVTRTNAAGDPFKSLLTSRIKQTRWPMANKVAHNAGVATRGGGGGPTSHHHTKAAAAPKKAAAAAWSGNAHDTLFKASGHQSILSPPKFQHKPVGNRVMHNFAPHHRVAEDSQKVLGDVDAYRERTADVRKLAKEAARVDANATSLAHADFSDFAKLQKALDKCWKSGDPMQMFTDETCHLMWTLFLARAKIVRIDQVEKAPSHTTEKNGGFRVTFDNGMKGMFKSCDDIITQESWKAELYAHEIDRMLALHRVPAVAARTITLAELEDIDVGHQDKANLKDIMKICNGGGHELVGSVMGWLAFPVEIVFNFDSHFMNKREWNIKKLAHADLEWCRLLMSLLALGENHKMGHNIAQAKFETGAVKIHELLLIGIDNDRARWTKPSRHENEPAKEKVVCDRKPGKKVFTCKFAPEAHYAQYIEFLESACVFPASIVNRLWLYSSANEENPVSLRASEQLALQLDTQMSFGAQPKAWETADAKHVHDKIKWDLVNYKYYSGRVLDLKVERIVKIVKSCLDRYPIEEVIFNDIPTESVGKSAKVPQYSSFVDAGEQEYKFNDVVGVWRKFQGKHHEHLKV